MAETLALHSEFIPQADRERQFRYDLHTQFAELVDGNMRTEFDLKFNGYDLVGEDGRGLNDIADKSLLEARRIAKENPQLWFELRRRKLEKEEISEVIDMASGKGSNTIIVISDFPAELVNAKEDVGGYNVRRQQTMLRVLTRQADGNIRMYSQSLDRSDRLALEDIYKAFGIMPMPGELLGQRIRTNLSSEEQLTVVDRIAGIYDKSLTERLGGTWYAGRRPAEYQNTYDFVCNQGDLIQECIRLQKLGWLTDDFMYNVAAEMNARFTKVRGEHGQLQNTLHVIDQAMLHKQLEYSGRLAKQAGASFSACGVTLRADGLDDSTENNLEQAGYGNKSKKKDCEFISKKCPECGAANVKTRSKQLDNGKTHVIGSCGCSKTYAKVT